MDKLQKRGNFTGYVGFVLAASGSAVGLGNIWRFPYLAARDGGGLFLIVYVVLAITFGFALLTTEIAIGRKTGQSPLTAYGKLHQKWKWLGLIACAVPIIILPYYSAIGGWILNYLAQFLTGNAGGAAVDGYFGGFITSPVMPIVWFLVFIILTAAVVFNGVNKGIERFSKVLMPILFVLIIFIAIFSLTLKHTDANGVTRTGLEGFLFYVTPNMEGMTFSRFMGVVMDACSQLFFSISVAMGIMITYGSYVKKETNLVKSVNMIEIFDTAVAFLAGMMIIPAVFVFMGLDGMAAGPSLMFVALPKVFEAMGVVGPAIGVIFFVMVAFAALTSSVSLMEAITSCFMDKFTWGRKKAAGITFVIILILGLIVCFGYNIFYFELTLPNGSVAQILDVMDYAASYVLMPIVAIATCLLVGYAIKPKTMIDEITLGGHNFIRKTLYVVMVKFITPILTIVLLLQSTGALGAITKLFS